MNDTRVRSCVGVISSFDGVTVAQSSFESLVVHLHIGGCREAIVIIRARLLGDFPLAIRR